MSASWGLRTKLVHGGHRRSPLGETCEALFLTSGFTYAQAEDAEGRFADKLPGFMYSRVGNPTVRTFEERMMLLEGSEEAAATATGMAAVNAALMCQLRAGSRVVAARCLFGSCHYILTEILPRFGVEVELVDGPDLEAWALALSRKTDAVFLETPGNPTLELVDIAAVSATGAQGGCPGDRRQRLRHADAAAAAGSWVRTSSSTRRPSTSTARGAASAASSSAMPSSSRSCCSPT